ncbi:MAG: class I SAM-dependent methyltransferase [Chitinophagaceae bacterium]|nr:class I SAM-dependent methyltransferase [Chitinophagaceae bacterium]
MFSFSDADLAFMSKHAQSDVPGLLLRGKWSEREKELLEQVFRKQKAGKKLPSCALNPQFYWPPSLNLEQSSSEKTARFKAGLMHGKRLLDLSAGMGIDALFLSASFEQVDLVEPNAELSAISAYNLGQVMGLHHAVFHGNRTAEDFVSILNESVDWIYIDPSRRNEQGKKVFKLADCVPNIIELAPTLLQRSKQCMVKLSPMADVQQLRRELPNISTVYALQADGECKELLLILEANPSSFKKIAVDLDNDSPIWVEETENSVSEIPYHLPQAYIYEPNAACHKLQVYAAIAKQYGLNKLHPDSHLFTSENWVPHFPGRTFQLKDILPLDRKQLQERIPDRKAHITVRNFPMRVADIRAKTKLVDGGNVYLLATTLIDRRKVILFCVKPNEL